MGNMGSVSHSCTASISASLDADRAAPVAAGWTHTSKTPSGVRTTSSDGAKPAPQRAARVPGVPLAECYRADSRLWEGRMRVLLGAIALVIALPARAEPFWERPRRTGTHR